MEEIYGFTFPKGSGELVDQAIVQFVKRIAKDKLNEVAKLHFKNTQKSESV
jgi:ribonuclease HIII